MSVGYLRMKSRPRPDRVVVRAQSEVEALAGKLMEWFNLREERARELALEAAAKFPNARAEK